METTEKNGQDILHNIISIEKLPQYSEEHLRYPLIKIRPLMLEGIIFYWFQPVQSQFTNRKVVLLMKRSMNMRDLTVSS